jgi:CRP/FNR family transcriptional regulator, cyclic AMP receptor protein
MESILEILAETPTRHADPGETIIEEGTSTGALFFLISGEVEVFRSEVSIAIVSEPGAVFGEMSVLLGTSHRASVRTVKPSAFHFVSDGRRFLQRHNAVSFHVSEVLAQRLEALNKYLVDVKRQFEGHDHLSMVDEVLEVLAHRQRRPRLR